MTRTKQPPPDQSAASLIRASGVRFVAEWITAQHFDEAGEWIPDDDEVSCSDHVTLEGAQAAAIAGSRAAGAVEWVAVEEQHRVYDEDTAGRFVRWETVRRWCGDYEHWDEDLGL